MVCWLEAELRVGEYWIVRVGVMKVGRGIINIYTEMGMPGTYNNHLLNYIYTTI